MHGSWDMECGGQNFLFWTIFSPFTLLTTPKPLQILSFYKCVTQMKIRWCMVPQTWSAKDRIFVILDHFLPFYPKTTWKIKILKKWKNSLEILSFYKSVPKIMIICSTVPEIWLVTDVVFIFHFGLFFALSLI